MQVVEFEGFCVFSRFARLSILAAIGLVGENACAMNGPAFSSGRCQVIGGEKLPAEAGSADEICAAILAAADSRGAGTSYSVEVRVLSPSSMAATVQLACPVARLDVGARHRADGRR